MIYPGIEISINNINLPCICDYKYNDLCQSTYFHFCDLPDDITNENYKKVFRTIMILMKNNNINCNIPIENRRINIFIALLKHRIINSTPITQKSLAGVARKEDKITYH